MSAHTQTLALVLIASAAVGLSGCDSIRSVFARGGADASGDRPATAASLDQSAASQSGDPTPTPGEREVEFPVVAQAVTDNLFPGGGDAKFAESSVPVLAPAAMSTDQAETFADSYQTTPDGYFARMPSEEFDVVVNGTRAYAVAPEAAGAQTRDTSAFQFSESDTGLSVTFNRFGADYSIDFVCRGAGGDAGGCVDETKAAEFVERLVPVGGGGR